MPTLAQQLSDEIADIVETARRSLVQVRSGRHSGGAGTIWHSKGLVLTNAHVVGSARLQVTLGDGRTFRARLLARDARRDVAALAIDANNLPTIPPGDSREVRPGQLVLALGHPWGVVGAAASGVVIEKATQWARDRSSGREWIAVSLNLRPGNSGGPLIDVDGQLIGINTVMTGPEVGMAVPVHVVKRFLSDALGTKATVV